MKKVLAVFILILLMNSLSNSTYAQINIKDFGAKGDGVILDTRSIQDAIDKAFEKGGGTVDVPAGTYLIGTLILKDNIELHLQPGSVLLGSPDFKDYTEIIHKFQSRTNGLYGKYFMIFAEGANNISITGSGIINGNGLTNFQQIRPMNQRPMTIRLVDCENVLIRDVHLLEAASMALHLLGCRTVNIDGIVIEENIIFNRDGLDIDCCQGVKLSNSQFSTGDDAIVMKSTSDVICQDITITNCIINSKAACALKIGTESNGGFKNITVSNCTIKDLTVHTGIELMAVDGGMMQNILFENITMENVATPFFIRTGIRAKPYMTGQYVSKIDEVRDIFLNNISVINAKLPSSIMGLHNRKIKNIVITNYSVRNSETQNAVSYNEVPFEEFSYPMAIMFSNLPAYGLYCRNVEELHLQNITMYSAENEVRPAITFDRVNNLELFSVKAEVKSKTIPMVHLRNSTNITAAFCRSIGITDVLFEEENTVENLNLYNNILQAGQRETAKVASLPDSQLFDDFKTELKYSVEKGKIINGLTAQSLNNNPLRFNIEMNVRGSVQMCLLILNDSKKPEKVIVKYQGITQEFLVNWNEWGWAPISLLKEFPTDGKVDFEISAFDQNSLLTISKVYFRYQDIGHTD